MTARHLADVRDYDALLECLRARIDDLGTTYSAIEDYAQIPSGHLGHILGRSQNKTLGVILVFRLMEALGLRFDVVEHLDKAATIDEMDHHYRPRQEHFRRNGVVRKHLSNDLKCLVMREMGARGGTSRLTKMTPEERSEIARRGGVARQAQGRPAKRLAKRREKRFKLGRN